MLAQAVAQLPAAEIVVAFSGGLDSTVLLHLLRHQHPTVPLRAIHIHHGLQADADQWPAHCIAVCDSLGVACQVEYIEVTFRDVDWDGFLALVD